MGTAPDARVFSISLPPDLARKAEELARRESRTLSDLFCEALNAYEVQQARSTLADIGEYAAGRDCGYTEEDVPRVIAEVRSEHRAAR